MVKIMKVVIAIDSFKGSLSSMEAGKAAAEGVRHAVEADIVIRPLADGGEGTTEALISGLGGTYQQVEVTGPLGEKVMARYGILSDGKTAVMEMAEAAGITLMDADVVITGEGCLDEQTAMGKLPVGVAHLAKKHHAMVLAFAGSIKDGGEICNKEGIDAVFPIVRGVTSLEEAMKPETAKKNMTLAVEQVFRLISCR